MFCYQCEQAANGKGCQTKMGVCGKDESTAALQDLLIHSVSGIARHAHQARQMAGLQDRAIDVFVTEALFATVTNVDFDPERLRQTLLQGRQIAEKARALYEQACAKTGAKPEERRCPAMNGAMAEDLDALIESGQQVSVTRRREALGDDVAGLQEFMLYGLKGAAAYTCHAHDLGHDDDNLYAGFHEILDFYFARQADLGKTVDNCMKVGRINLRAMELLDAANTGAYGHPVPTSVRVEPLKGKAILISGHDLQDLHALLKQTEGKGINVYTHSEMLPAHGYPKLKAFKHLAGNYGSAWQLQAKEFDEFPGAIVMTTNCIQRPRDSYKGRLFTTNLVAWPGVQHIGPDKDFTPVIEAALAAPGFAADGPDKTITVGFGHEAVMSVAGKVIDAVKAGKIRRFFLVGGCDGAKPGRSYYTDFAQAIPKDCMILTLACGKYRFNKMDFGTIDGLPRLLDIGQCNDAYSAIQIATALAKAFNCGVNDLPLSLVLSWYEQKAVGILLTLLALGIKNIRIGPSLPAPVTPAVLQTLVTSFGLTPISTPDADLKAIFA